MRVKDNRSINEDGYIFRWSDPIFYIFISFLSEGKTLMGNNLLPGLQTCRTLTDLGLSKLC